MRTSIRSPNVPMLPQALIRNEPLTLRPMSGKPEPLSLTAGSAETLVSGMVEMLPPTVTAETATGAAS